jgi:endonuclease/exonuclease/phosphatase family metal-dependent hydrolase
VVRLEQEGAWFDDGDRGEPRVGGRVAVVATWNLGGTPVTVAAVHLESHSETWMREQQTIGLLDALDEYAPGQPTIVAGDLNTFSLGHSDAASRERIGRLFKEDPARLTHPIPYEPLFEAARNRGYCWEDCNEMQVGTQRVVRPDASHRGAMKIDWFLGRGLRFSGARVLEAVDPESGRALSDHEPLAVTCGL